MHIIHREQIERVLPQLDLVDAIQSGFVAYSRGLCVVPPVGELLLDKGELHIKYGYIKGDEHYVVKLASGFYQNPALGLPSSNGLMQLFSQHTGELKAILLDEGRLTDVRTAVAGAVCARYLAPKEVRQIGIVGTGIQGCLQLEYLLREWPEAKVAVWGRDPGKVQAFCREFSLRGDGEVRAETLPKLCAQSQLIVTTTPSSTPLIKAEWVQAGCHITAVGSDTPHKQELESEILAKADLVVADSISQCLSRGEIARALTAKCLHTEEITELGTVIERGEGRTSEHQLTVADLTGVAVQDIRIAQAVYEAVIQGDQN